jgi:hypothetical protein
MSSPSKIPFRSPLPKPSVSVVMPVAAAPLAEVSTLVAFCFSLAFERALRSAEVSAC